MLNFIKAKSTYLIALSVFSIILPSSAFCEIVTKELQYSSGETKLTGYLAFDSSKTSKLPGVIVVHEWWGHNDYVRRRANMLAEMGYVAFAIDMYGSGKSAKHPKDAEAFMKEAMASAEVAKQRFLAGRDFLAKQPNVDSEKIAAIGYCFGGGVVLSMARQAVELAGVVSFHGSLASEKRLTAKEDAPAILVLHGQDDEFVKKEDIVALKNEMEAAKADFTYIEYSGAKHSFTNPGADAVREKFGTPLAYDAEADAASWKEMQSFFKRIFSN